MSATVTEDDEQIPHPPPPPPPRCAICRGPHTTANHPKSDDEPGG